MEKISKLTLPPGTAGILVRPDMTIELLLPEHATDGPEGDPALLALGLAFMLGQQGWIARLIQAAKTKLVNEGLARWEKAA